MRHALFLVFGENTFWSLIKLTVFIQTVGQDVWRLNTRFKEIRVGLFIAKWTKYFWPIFCTLWSVIQALPTGDTNKIYLFLLLPEFRSSCVSQQLRETIRKWEKWRHKKKNFIAWVYNVMYHLKLSKKPLMLYC